MLTTPWLWVLSHPKVWVYTPCQTLSERNNQENKDDSPRCMSTRVFCQSYVPVLSCGSLVIQKYASTTPVQSWMRETLIALKFKLHWKNNLKHNEAGFSTTLMVLLYLLVAQMPRCPDLVILWWQADRRTKQITLPLVHVRGVTSSKRTKYSYRCWYWELWSHDLPTTYPQYLCSRVNNKEGKKVSNTLYTPCNMCSESNVTSLLAHVTNSRG